MEESKNTYNRTSHVEQITRIDFSIASNELIMKDSAIADPNGLTVAETYNNGEPVQGGVLDPRLGTTDKRTCKTCGEGALGCPGHFGHVPLSEPVFHIGYINFVKMILERVCLRCHKLLVHKNEEEIARIVATKTPKQRMNDLRNETKGITHCQKNNYGCGTPAHKITIEKKNANFFLLAEAINKSSDADNDNGRKRTQQIITARLCYDIFSCISDTDCMIMGFNPKINRPEDMLILNFPVPPPQVRPSVRFDTSSSTTKDDSLTQQLIDIIKNNENLKGSKSDGSLSRGGNMNDDYMLLQFHIITMFDNEVANFSKALQKNKTPLKSLSERLKGKEGRVRGNLMGKRVNMSARTVITSDPNINLNEVGVPLMIARNLSFPEFANEKNMAYLTQLVQNRTKKYPGANYIIKNTIDREGYEVRSTINLKYREKPVTLAYGDIVGRQLISGDMVLFNRQPSLHKMSMMAHKSHIIEDPRLLTLRMNVSATGPYNADFDGDEMNIHAPQSLQTVVELALIANVEQRFVSPAKSKIVIQAVQDTVMGSYVMNYDDIRIDWKDAMNILMATGIELNGSIPKGTLVSGKHLYSQILPPNINLVKKDDDGNYTTRIINSKIHQGLFGKEDIGNIIHKSWFQHPKNVTREFVDNLQKMILQFLMRYGFTMSVGSIAIDRKVTKSIRGIAKEKVTEIYRMITEYENDTNAISQDVFETNIRESLRAVKTEMEKYVMSSLNPYNNIYITFQSGSSGDSTNAGQIMGFIGQVIVEGKRILNRYNERTLPMFYKYDNSAYARGYCKNSFLSGLNPAEFFFQVMSGREGIINTAIKTADTGYIQRKLVKILEDIKVGYDGMVRNANDKVIQLVYGGNGVNVEKQIQQKINLMKSDNDAILSKYIYTEDELSKFTGSKYDAVVNEKLYRKLIAMRDNMRNMQKMTNIASVAFRDTFMMPIDMQQIITNVISRENRVKGKRVDPYYVLNGIKELYDGDSTRIIKLNKKRDILKKKDDRACKTLLKFYLYDILCPKICTNEYKLTVDEFDEIIESTKLQFRLSLVEGGEMSGMVAAQSIGEPVSQSNLKSFHKAGTGAGVSGGLPRVKELLGASKIIKEPYMKVVLDDQYKTDKNIAAKIASHLKYTTIGDVVDFAGVYYDPNPMNKNSMMMKDGATSVFQVSQGKGGCQSDVNVMPLTLRLVLSKEKMIEKSVSMMDIKTSFCANWSNRTDIGKGKKEAKKVIEKVTQVGISSNFDNSPTPIVHIRFDCSSYDQNTFIQFLDFILTSYRIKGMVGVTESKNIYEEKYKEFGENGKVIEKKQFIVSTEGINMEEITQIRGINLKETICNDIVLIHQMFGVEAARAAMIKELSGAIESSGVFSNYQHIELLVDAIMHLGGMIAVSRHGANKLDTDPLSKASFEKTVEKMLEAAVFAESDHVRSVSSRIMVGALINGGTGSFNLLLDHDVLKKGSTNKKKKEVVKAIKSSNVQDLIKKKKK